MRVLFDTNVLISRENYHILPENLQELVRILNSLGVVVLVHPRSMDEIKRDRNEERKKIALSKFQTYPLLESPPDPRADKHFLGIVGIPFTVNDYVDNALLYAVHKDAVDFLISEDGGIHNKALRLNLEDRVLSSEEALAIFRKDLLRVRVKRPPALKEEYVYNLNLDDPFFISLKQEYAEFEVWFKKISREGRKCWVYYEEDGSIGALLIYKVENEPIDSSPPIPAKERLKLCTFKVGHTGYKLGELFIKLSVQHCVNRHLTEMYLTYFTKEDDLFADLLNEYGFLKAAKINDEDVYVKKLIPNREEIRSLSPFEISRRYYPSFYDGPLVSKFVVPILPEYHNRLFIGYEGRQTTIPEHAGEFIIEGNTIGKAYLCHSNIRKMSKGDILLFYRSRDLKEVTSLGIVEKVSYRVKDKDMVTRLVGKRTVYPIREIEEILKKPTLVILFRWHFHLSKPLKLSELMDMKMLKRAPQTITKIHHNKYVQLKRRGQLDERYTVDRTEILRRDKKRQEEI